jgi:hypothetical protein
LVATAESSALVQEAFEPLQAIATIVTDRVMTDVVLAVNVVYWSADAIHQLLEIRTISVHVEVIGEDSVVPYVDFAGVGEDLLQD